jgi:N-acetylglucosaminyl-diphospho-decaprenol L-rhamnosyltransferase
MNRLLRLGPVCGEVDRVNPLQGRRPAKSSRLEPRLTVIIVNFESWPDVVRLVESVTSESEFASGRCQVVVVDNASRGPIPESISGERPGLRIVARPDNGGFAVGVNAGWRAARSRWLLVLNPDVETTAGFLGRVFTRLDHYETDPGGPPGIVGFGLRNPDGSPQGSVGAFPTLARSIWEQFLPRSRRKYQPGWRIRAGAVDWVTGACMLVNASMIAELGGMDEDFFLYHEEVAFSQVARRRGWRVEYDPSVSVVHRHPLQNRAISPKMRIITRHSKLLYFRKHLPRWQFWTLSAIVTIEAAIQGRWSQYRGRQDEVRAWRTITEVARRLRRGIPLRGRAILELAESAAAPECQPGTGLDSAAETSSASSSMAPASLQRSAGMHRGRPGSGAALLEPRKDGTA